MSRIRREIIIVVVPISTIREFIAVDIIGSTTFYYLLKLALKKLVLVEPIAIAGSIVLPLVYKKIAHRSAAPRSSVPPRISLQG
ncbi:hypothetical protein DFQ01_13624 [Paenibacillus cellulosilyticus]|uniref:Uncharacterized protein n=1 Tax=Paenibacillus cellulosilyticus TaxID=375489 RepID=A0A2V2YK01_9BACL|nr:hypothetical protein [Paenibacillus cellulosilyticus]PWV92078.1 hypothetical protein DFQ01_13624 [Paenibacillus cellulosilyticus]QKS44189.1 hypothetical protein HUB94_06960 [Paenibacillus cellulosilyticus]